MHPRHHLRILALLVLLLPCTTALRGEIEAKDAYTFKLKQTVVIERSAQAVWDALTGDVSGWWDHSFSEKPARFVLEARPGGSFLELFDEEGNGVEHARVTYVKAPERIHFEGPLPFNGLAMRMSHVITLKPEDAGGTRVTVAVNAIGDLEEGWAEAVDGVWNHFLRERLKPFVEGTLND